MSLLGAQLLPQCLGGGDSLLRGYPAVLDRCQHPGEHLRWVSQRTQVMSGPVSCVEKSVGRENPRRKVVDDDVRATNVIRLEVGDVVVLLLQVAVLGAEGAVLIVAQESGPILVRLVTSSLHRGADVFL